MTRHPAGSAEAADRGAALVMFALCLVVLLAASAFAVDLGQLFVERRQSQSAADTGALGGALDLGSGMTVASEATAEMVRANLRTEYDDATWAAVWGACNDPGSLRFTGTVLGTATDCISFDGLGTYRVVLPEQAVDTAFAGVVGFDQFSTSALAEVEVTVGGIAGVLPFAVLNGAPNGTEICMRSSSGGTATPPCTGSASGNFGALEVAQWGNPLYGTQSLACNLPKTDQLLVNLSVGIDHFLTTYTGTEVVDSCSKPFGPNTLSTFQGISGGLFEGLVSGAVVQGTTFPGRLTRGGTSLQTLRWKTRTYQVDDVPLWEYISYGKAGTVPPSCERETFDSVIAASGHAAGETAMAQCFTDFQAGTGYAPLFDADADGDGSADILASPRFGAVPQFHESAFPSGNSGDLHIARFRGVFINTLSFGCNGNSCAIVYTPGSQSGTLVLPNGSSPLSQMSAWLVPDAAFPPQVLENGVNGNLGVFQVRLSR